MKSLKIFKYTLWQDLKGYTIFFGIIFAIINIFLVISLLNNSGGSLGGMESSTMIFTFLIGFITYKENFKMSVQNGISRKSFFIGNGLSCLLVSIIAAAGDILFFFLGKFYQSNVENFNYTCLYEQIYDGKSINDVSKQLDITDFSIIKLFCFYVGVYIAMICLGIFIGVVFNRLTKILKIAVPVGIYLICMVVAFVDNYVFNSAILSKLGKLFSWIAKSSYNLVGFCLAASVVLIFAGFLFARRMPINDKM